MQRAPDDLVQLKPTVVVECAGDLAVVCDELEHQLINAKVEIFQRGGMLVRVVAGGSQQSGIERDPVAPRIVAFDDVSLADLITRHIEIWKRNLKTQDLRRVDCPRALAQTLLARRQWDFPELVMVVDHPVMLRDGSVLWESGYHASTGLLFRLEPYTFQSPYEEPSRAEAEACLVDLRGLIDGFSFLSDTDESVALAMLMTPFVRPILPTCPAFAVNAYAAGSGKSTLVRTMTAIATGRDPAFLTYGEDPGELRKLLFASLLEGDQHIAIDNIDIPVTGADLAVILTSPVYRGRVLGQSVNASVPTKAMITLNGNNLQIVGDLTRRVLECRLDPACDRPAERTFESDPLKEARECRGDFVHDALVIMGAYIASGERVSVGPFGSFEDWSRLVREALVWLGMPDPVDSIRGLEELDPERMQLRAMLTAVGAIVGAGEFKAAELIAKVAHARGRANDQAEIDGCHDAPLTPEQRGALNEALQAVCERNGELNAKALGRWFLRMKGRVEGARRFVRGRQTAIGAMWRIETTTGL